MINDLKHANYLVRKSLLEGDERPKIGLAQLYQYARGFIAVDAHLRALLLQNPALNRDFRALRQNHATQEFKMLAAADSTDQTALLTGVSDAWPKRQNEKGFEIEIFSSLADEDMLVVQISLTDDQSYRLIELYDGDDENIWHDHKLDAPYDSKIEFYLNRETNQDFLKLYLNPKTQIRLL